MRSAVAGPAPPDAQRGGHRPRQGAGLRLQGRRRGRLSRLSWTGDVTLSRL